jgi:histidyl-tRNA synthetase
MSSNPQPIKLYYDITAYRYENVQKGRYREFNQLGAEVLGSDSPNADVEILNMLNYFFSKLGIQGLKLHVNSIGCKVCRTKYNEMLKEFFADKLDDMCEDCKQRYIKINEVNRLQTEKCSVISKDAPMLIDNLCDSCKEHFENVIRGLDEMNTPYIINKRIVRGLDYYVRTVFEFIAEGIGAQDTVCAGGRYDGLVEELGGTDTPGIGFAMGLERLISTLEKSGFVLPYEKIL